MDDPDHHRKSQREQVEELEILHRQVTEPATDLAGDDDDCVSRRRSRLERQPLTATIEFIGDFDVVQATGIDLSSGGICFEVAAPLDFEMRLAVEGVTRRYRAHLVWTRELEGGRCRMGFRFVTPE